MGYLMRRTDLCARLKIDEHATSYKILGTTRGRLGLINTDRVVDILNNSRRAGQPCVSTLPDDIYTADDVAKKLDCGITGEQLTKWCKTRTKKVPPHWKITNKTRRFKLSSLKEWLDTQTKVVRSGM